MTTNHLQDLQAAASAVNVLAALAAAMSKASAVTIAQAAFDPAALSPAAPRDVTFTFNRAIDAKAFVDAVAAANALTAQRAT